MHPIRARIIQLVLTGSCAISIVSGCASFQGGKLPSYTGDQLIDSENKISLSYDIKAFGPDGEEIPKAVPLIEKEIKKVLSAVPVFVDLMPGTASQDYHLSFVFRNEGFPPKPLAFISGYITGFTFGVIPAYARDIFIITVEVKQGEKVIKTYTYQDHMNSWFHISLIFLTPFKWPPTVSRTVIDNMIMNFAHDFSKDVALGEYIAQK